MRAFQFENTAFRVRFKGSRAAAMWVLRFLRRSRHVSKRKSSPSTGRRPQHPDVVSEFSSARASHSVLRPSTRSGFRTCSPLRYAGAWLSEFQSTVTLLRSVPRIAVRHQRGHAPMFGGLSWSAVKGQFIRKELCRKATNSFEPVSARLKRREVR